MSSINMNKKDLIELYQLLTLYKQTYNAKVADELIGDIYCIYKDMTGDDIKEAHNPRLAGRRPKYDDSMNDRIRLLHSEGLTYRKIASETGVSYGYVEKILKKHVNIN